MEQGSKEWLEWRKSGIGASESSQILERNPYGTRLDLWLTKTGREPEKGLDFLMDSKGKVTETALRNRYSLHTGRNYQPACAFHDKHKFMLASLDGWDMASGKGIEVKLIGKEKFDAAGDDPETINFMMDHHRIQVQHQMFVMEAPEWEYLIACLDDPHGTYKVFKIKADYVMQSELFKACKKFWKYVTTDKQPPYGPDDYRPIKDKTTLKLIDFFKIAKAKDQKPEVERLKLLIRARLKYPKMKALGVKISPSGFRLEKVGQGQLPAVTASQDTEKEAIH